MDECKPLEVGCGTGAATYVMTASADGVARAWSVGGEEGSGDVVAQHACECYAAAWHPAGGGIENKDSTCLNPLLLLRTSV